MLPEVEHFTVAGCTITVTHDAGPTQGRLERMRRRFPSAAAVVFGHSHLPLHEAAPDGFQIFNPGSPTRRRRHPRHTMGLATVEEGAVSFEIVPLD
jgi:predicted phosphodiesterase